MIRDMKPEDCAAVARFWRDYLNVPAATDESVRRTFEKMSGDSRYFSYVAEGGGTETGA